MNDPIGKARELLADPRGADWLNQPGRAGHILGVLRGVLTETDVAVEERNRYRTLLQATSRDLGEACTQREKLERDNVILAAALRKAGAA